MSAYVILNVVADARYLNGALASACEAGSITHGVPANRAINNQSDATLFTARGLCAQTALHHNQMANYTVHDACTVYLSRCRAQVMEEALAVLINRTAQPSPFVLSTHQR